MQKNLPLGWAIDANGNGTTGMHCRSCWCTNSTMHFIRTAPLHSLPSALSTHSRLSCE
jgi:hypothetical protein